jgi:uncharacterized ion transporter superfamily protein YfcC
MSQATAGTTDEQAPRVESVSAPVNKQAAKIAPATALAGDQVAEPQRLPSNLSRRALDAATRNVIVILGISVVAVIIGSMVLAWFDRVVPEATLVMGGVALGYLGNAIQAEKGG